MFGGHWRPATVVEVDRRGAVAVEREFVNQVQRGIFTQEQVRMKCEVDALGLVREWRDASGQFRIRAALLRYSGEQLTLRKIDMKEITVPLSTLGDSDQRYFATIKKAAPAGARGSGGLAPVEQFAGTPAASSLSQGLPVRGGNREKPPVGPRFGPQNRPPVGGEVPRTRGFGERPNLTFSAADVDRRALAPDPLPAYLVFRQGGSGFSAGGPSMNIGAVIPVGGQKGWVLASLEKGFGGSTANPTGLVWVSLADQKVEKTQTLPCDDVVLDYHAPSHRLLTFSRKSIGRIDEPRILSVWEVLPTDDAVQSIVRWESPRSRIDSSSAPWARFVDGNLVIQHVSKHEFLAWDLAEKAVRYRIDHEGFFGPNPTLSGTRRYFALPEDRRVRLFDAATGENVSTLPVQWAANAVAFSRDGRRLAVLEGCSLSLWDLTDAQAEPERLQAEAIRGGFAMTMSWIDDRHLVVDRRQSGMALFSLEHRVVLWSYEFDREVNTGHDSSRSRSLVANHLVYSAKFSEGPQSGLAVGAVRLPGADPEQAVAALDPDTLMLLRPGSPVRVEAKTGEFDDQVRASLERHVQNNGWKLDPNATNVLIAEIKRGETEEVTYDFRGRRPNETVSVIPNIHTMRIVIEGETAWEVTANTGVPALIAIGEDSSVQDEVNRSQKPNPSFFDGVKIPERIPDPKKKNGFGTSAVTNRGLFTK